MSPFVLGALILLASLPVLWWAMSGARGTAAGEGGGDGLGPANLHEAALETSATDRVVKPGMAKAFAKVSRVTPVGIVRALDLKIARAGLQGKLPIEVAVVAKVFFGVTGGLLTLLILAVDFSLLTLIAAGLFLVLGYFGVDTVIGRRAEERQKQIQRTLPDLLDQVSISVEAGLGFEAALLKAVQTSDGPLVDEFGRALQDVRLGVPRRDTFEAILGRTDVPDLRLFIRSLAQAEKNGVPIARVLTVQSEEVREKRRQRAEERAMQMPVKLVIPLILFILPCLFLVVIGPAGIRIAENGLGGG